MQSLEEPNIESPAAGRQRRWINCALLAAITALAIFLRIQQAGESLWLDELHTAWTVSGGLGELPHRAAMGNNSPLYFVLPWATTRIFGMSEWALRLPSLIAGTALIPLLYWVVRRWTDSPACGMLAAFLAAIEPNFVFFSLEARPYVFVQLLGLLQMCAFWSALQTPSVKNRAAWILLSAALFYTHYTAILILPGEAAFLLFMQLIAYWRSRYGIFSLLVDLALIGLLIIPAAPHLWDIMLRRENWWLFVPPPRILEGFDMLPLYFTPVLVEFAVLGRDLITRRPIPPRQQRIRSLALLMFVVILFAQFVPYMTTRYGIAALWVRRYMMAASAAPPVMAGLMCASTQNRLVRRLACLATAIVALLWTIPPWHWSDVSSVYSHSEENWRGAVAHINAADDARDWPVLVRSGLIEANGLVGSNDAELREYCLLPVRSIYSLGEDRIAIPLAASMPGRIGGEDIERLAGSGGVWLVTSGGEEIAKATLKLVKRKLRRSGMQPGKETAAAFGRVWVMRVPLK